MDDFFFQCTKLAFEELRFDFRPVPKKNVIECGLRTHSGEYNIHLQAIEKIKVIVFTAEIKKEVNFNRLEHLLRIISRANNDLILGAFELDLQRKIFIFRHGNAFHTPKISEENYLFNSSYCVKTLCDVILASISECDRFNRVIKKYYNVPEGDVPKINPEKFWARETTIVH